MRLEILEYANRWTTFFHGMGKAYTLAYESQVALLKAIKPKVTARKKKEEEARLLGLSILTTLAVGPLAPGFGASISPIAQKIDAAIGFDGFTKAGQAPPVPGRPGPAAPTAFEKMAMSEIKDFVIADWVAKIKGWAAYTPDPAKFEPAGMSPAAYIETLQQGAGERAGQMTETVVRWQTKADRVDPATAQMLVDRHRKSRFITDAPAIVMSGATKELLLRKAKLALWIAWAWDRDKDYWEETIAVERNRFSAGKTEAGDWEPLRLELLRIGVPPPVVNTWGVARSAFGFTRLLNFPAFIEWSYSLAAFATVAAQLPADAQTTEIVRLRWLNFLISRQGS